MARHVYPTQELCHLWAHGADRDLRNSKGSVYSIRDTIYSYGSHFPMGRRVEVRGTVVFLYNSESYSVTTSSHQSTLHSAMRGNGEIIALPPRLWDSVAIGAGGVDIRAHFQALVDARMAEAHNTRMGYWRRSQACQAAASLIEDYETLVDYFKMRVRKGIPHPAMPDLQESKLKYEANQARLAEKRERTRKKNARLYEEARLERERKDDELRASVEERMVQWLNGETVSTQYFPRGALMRIHDGQVETTMGARVPVDEVRRFIREDLPTVRREPGLRYNVSCGPYRGATDAGDALVIGCHRFPWLEVQRIVALLTRTIIPLKGE